MAPEVSTVFVMR